MEYMKIDNCSIFDYWIKFNLQKKMQSALDSDKYEYPDNKVTLNYLENLFSYYKRKSRIRAIEDSGDVMMNDIDVLPKSAGMKRAYILLSNALSE